MTTIAYKNGVLACDKQGTCGGVRSKAACKLVVKDGFAYAITGSLAEGLAFIDRGLDMDELKLKWTTVLAMDLRTGKCVAYEEPGFPVPIEDSVYTNGSGGDIALGAMAAGATPEEAVRIAAKFDVSTGIGVQVVHSDVAKRKKRRDQLTVKTKPA